MNLTNVFIDILRSAMTQTSCDMIEGLSTQDWEKIYDISQKQQLAPMIYQQIFSNESFQNSDPGFQQFWKGDTIDQAGNQARKSILFLMLFDKMRQNGLTPLIVKGIVCRDLYPNPDLRTSNDEDLYIPRDQFGKMDEFLQAEGFMREELIRIKFIRKFHIKIQGMDYILNCIWICFLRNPERMGILINYLKMRLILVWKQIFKGVKY